MLMVPAFIYYLKNYEEYELAFRFGESYLSYKNKTSFLLPRKQNN